MPRWLRLALVVLAALVLLALAALGASAALDRPARIMMVSTAVDASKPEVWAVLTNFDDYDQWNPVITSAAGEPVVGAELDLELTLPGHDPEELDAEVLIVRGDRKLRWQDRLVVPGVRDFEYEFIIQPVEPGRVVVVQLLRSEGLLAPFTDEEAGREALALIGEALVERLAATGS
jgi:hypothetical protein